MNDIKVKELITELILEYKLNINIIRIINQYDKKELKSLNIKREKCHFESCEKYHIDCQTILCKKKEYKISPW
jgi:hypothetical protein